MKYPNSSESKTYSLYIIENIGSAKNNDSVFDKLIDKSDLDNLEIGESKHLAFSFGAREVKRIR